MFMAPLFQIESSGRGSSLCIIVERPWCAHFDPCGKSGYLILGQLPFRRHLQLRVFIIDCLNQFALVGFTEGDDRPIVTSFEETVPAIEQKAAFEFFAVDTVAFVTTLDEDG